MGGLPAQGLGLRTPHPKISVGYKMLHGASDLDRFFGTT
jgi:hypothetical protein